MATSSGNASRWIAGHVSLEDAKLAANPSERGNGERDRFIGVAQLFRGIAHRYYESVQSRAGLRNLRQVQCNQRIFESHVDADAGHARAWAAHLWNWSAFGPLRFARTPDRSPGGSSPIEVLIRNGHTLFEN